MGVFVFLPLVLPLTAWPIARLAEQRLHPRTATRLLTGVAVVMAVCSTVCLALLMVVGTAQLPGNPLPDGWSDPEVREAVPYDEVAGKAAIPALLAVAVACGRTLWRHGRVRRRAHRALAGLPGTEVAVLPDEAPYAYALPGGRGTGSSSPPPCCPASNRPNGAPCSPTSAPIWPPATTASCSPYNSPRAPTRSCDPCVRPCPTRRSAGPTRRRPTRSAAAGPWRARSARRRWSPAAHHCPTLAGFAAPGPVPRRVAALLGPAPPRRSWPSVFTTVGLAAWGAAVGTAVSAMSSANSAVTMVLILHAATPL